MPDQPQQEKVKFEGKDMRLGDRVYVVPSLSLGQAKKYWSGLLLLDEGVTAAELPKKWEEAIPIIHAALSRNYPDLTLDEAWDLVTLENFREVLLVISGQSGLKPLPGEKPTA